MNIISILLGVRVAIIMSMELMLSFMLYFKMFTALKCCVIVL